MASRNRLVRALASATSHLWFPATVAVARNLPRRIVRPGARRLGSAYFRTRPKYWNAVSANLSVILGQPADSAEVARAADEMFRGHFAAWFDFLYFASRPPHESAADGFTEDDAVEMKRWGEPPALEHPREHTEIGRFELERAAKLSGARFGFLAGDTALLAFALYRLALDRLVAEGFTPMIPPVLVREDAMYGTGFFPSDKSDYYAVPEDGLYLVGTSEVPLIGMHIEEILEELPINYCAFSSCFRREAGAAGRDTRGMFRVHQFQKVEMVAYTHPDESWDMHERMLAIEESLVLTVELPYRVVNTAAGDLSTAAAKRYDTEAWFPSQQRYREITSCSNTTDFQARRSGIRYRTEDGRLETPHTLNGTAATDRWVLAILENFQGEVPEALQRYGAPERVRG